MNINEVVFTDSLPKIDLHGFDRDSARVLHGFDRDSARVAINDFINDNIKMGNQIITIIHGVGSGIIRKTTAETLSKNKNVEEFKTDYFNQGCTIVKLKNVR